MSPARRVPNRLSAVARSALLGVAALVGAIGLALIWVARIAAARFVYVSELGATGEPTAEVFRWSLVLVAVSAMLVAVCAPRLRPRVRWLAAVPPAAVLAGSAIAFGVASQVTCTVGCPLPVGSAFTWQDLIHTSCAVLGFAGAAFVMLQVATDRTFRALARFSLISAIAVAVIAGIGGLLSVFRFGTQVGGVLELVATTVALLWLVGLATFLAVAVRRDAPEITRQAQPSHAATPARMAATYSE
ncbi:DUF998 domain-containing protein [Herbiconiux ginsengi]|uniref:DUF998 domain-containing protein n=1 Tax=Herbiconiux ginsengi TaxID=381665 RepID=A0A1H3TJH3_9MICO|nr:DUF998 domain-containing protein [Herbiconiux ginsengi]SDZ50404.1 Protein of unknown function [Herbiconiux ginsengi]